MADLRVISQEPGPHKGWCRQNFMVGETEWSLLTIDRTGADEALGESRSHISKADEKDRTLWSFDGVLTPQAAMEIIILAEGQKAKGKVEGMMQGRRQMKEALGL